MTIQILRSFSFCALVCALFLTPNFSVAQEGDKEEKVVEKPVRNPWEAGMLQETQTSLVWAPKTLEMVMQHRFGNLNSGTFDLLGIYGAANIRIGFNYGLFKNAQIGIGTEKNGLIQDLNWKYKILTQTRSNSMPIALTYYGNVEYSAKAKSTFGSEYQVSDRMSFFNQLIISRRFSKKLSIMLAANYAHFNQVDTSTFPGVEHDNFGFAVAGKYKISGNGNIILEYDMPLTTPEAIKPNLSLGIEIATSSHAFHIFATTYRGISYQTNMVYNMNDFTQGDILLGFNITRNWNL